MIRKISSLWFITFGAIVLSCDKEESITTQSKGSSSCSSCSVEEAFPEIAGKAITFNYQGQKFSVVQKGEHYILGGDIVLSKEQVSLLKGESHDNGRTAVNSISSIWPNRTVVYAIDPSLPNQFRVTDAIAHWQANTNVTFKLRTNESNFIQFTSGGGCSSYVGLIQGGQVITLADGCSTGNAIHEIGHAIGFYHEQCRSDRDNSITVNFSNILSGYENNFQTYTAQGLGGLQLNGFDFGSIMLYSSYDFSSNGLPTIVKRDGTTFVGQRNGLSQGDIDTYNYLYNRPYLALYLTNYVLIDTDTQQGQTWDVYVKAYTDATKTTPMNTQNNLEVHYVVVQNGGTGSPASITMPKGTNSIKLGKGSRITRTTGTKTTTSVGFGLVDLIQ